MPDSTRAPARGGEIFLPKNGYSVGGALSEGSVKSPKRLQLARQRVSTLVAALRAVPRGRYIAILAGLLALVIGRSAWGAHAPATWLLENAPVALGLLFLWATYRVMPLSRVSYTLIFLFTCLHETGAHWTYAKVPYDAWTHSLFGITLNEELGFTRNHFDRLVHFSYGLLLAYPIREVFLRVANVRGFWGYFLPLDFTASTSMAYELLEWATALVVGFDASNDFLGSQGDIWDAQKDMALASLGALLAMTFIALLTWRYKRDFAQEFAESLRVKSSAPLGEEALAKLQLGKAG
jgi:putative membrane protein